MYTLFADFLYKKYRIDAHYFLQGGFWLSVGQAITLGFGLLSTALFAYFLTPTDYGVYRYLIGVAVIISSFSLTGLGQSILQMAAKGYDGFYTATFKINLLYSLPIVFSGIIGAGYYYINGNHLLASGCLLIAVLQPLINTFQNTSSLLQGSQRFRESTTLHTFRMILITLISVISLFLTKSILILFFVYLASYLIVNILSHILYKPKSSLTPENLLKRYVAYAKHNSVRNIIATIAQRADAIIIFTQLGAVELAVYSIATVIPEQIKGSFKNLASLLLPKYAKHENHTVIMKSMPKRSFQLLIILLTVTIAYILIAPLLFKIIFPKYPNAAFLSQLFALSFPAMIAILPASLLQSQLREKELYQFQIAETGVTVLFSFILTLQYGVVGAILAKVFTRYITMTYNFFLLYKK